jgi:two-component system, OmpR family, alkaline phosphatase synthesis response regulator PhoP
MDDPVAVLRRHGIAVDPASGQVSVAGTLIALSKTELGLLCFLASCAGNACSRQQIIVTVRGENYPVTEHSVDHQVMRLRKKLGEAGKLIETVRGVGFRFQGQTDC